MERGDLGPFLRGWWWLLVVLPVVGGLAGLWAVRDAPYLSQTRATVVLAGDTEIPGSSERPELMILDDAPALVTSQAFAAAAHAALPGEWREALPVGAVHEALTATRYSRVLTIVAARPDAASAQAIAQAAADVLPAMVDAYLVAPGEPAANVRTIDPASPGMRDRTAQALRVAAQAGAALLLALAAAVALDGIATRRAVDQEAANRAAR